MSAASAMPLLSPDHGIDPSSDDYRDSVSAVFRSLAVGSAATTGTFMDSAPDENLQLAARSADALNEVAEWANTGQSADPTACAWLSYLRWARSSGARPPESSPVPPSREFDVDFPVLGAPGSPVGDTFFALATGQFGEVSHPINPQTESNEVLARSVPYGLIPRLGWKALVPLVVDGAAITHGHAEAQTAAAATALAIHASVRARTVDASFDDVLLAVTDVVSGMTRPAPRTQALLARLGDITDETGLSADTAFSRTLDDGATASSALALGLAAAAVAHREASATEVSPALMTRALELVSAHPAATPAARSVAAAVTAARWGDRSVAKAPDRVVTELGRLAEQWCDRWAPR